MCARLLLAVSMALDREKFSAEELAICLSHYDLGLIQGVQEFARGSRRAPKVIVDAQRGKFLFKRRSRNIDDRSKVEFTHQIQLTLGQKGFPLPRLFPTRSDGNSMLIWNGSIYEMFEYVTGDGYDGSLDGTHSAGAALGRYHRLLESFQTPFTPPSGSYHNARAIRQALRATICSLPLEQRPSADVVTETITSLETAYSLGAARSTELGLEGWATQTVHGDWHPGNMLFRDGQVIAVVDYDAARCQQRVIDFANGALQFSIIGGSDGPEKWPEHVDESRFKRFLRGYDSDSVISVAELKAVPYLMCEAMIAEAVLPIAATGSFGRIQGFPFLQMIDRKVRWILSHLTELYGVLEA